MTISQYRFKPAAGRCQTGNGDNQDMSVDLGLLILRAVVGLSMAGHGAQKLFGWFGGMGLQETGTHFEGFGFRPGLPFAAAAGLSEFAGGILLAAGLFTPLGAAAI
jgi:putative oxidoreductase